jgi:hypothetical protein
MRKTLFAFSVIALAGGCGQANEEAFNREFDSNFRSSCVSSAVGSGAAEALATQICDCTLAGINEKFGMTDKMTMSPEQARPIMDECMTKAVQSNG